MYDGAKECFQSAHGFSLPHLPASIAAGLCPCLTHTPLSPCLTHLSCRLSHTTALPHTTRPCLTPLLPHSLPHTPLASHTPCRTHPLPHTPLASHTPCLTHPLPHPVDHPLPLTFLRSCLSHFSALVRTIPCASVQITSSSLPHSHSLSHTRFMESWAAVGTAAGPAYLLVGGCGWAWAWALTWACGGASALTGSVAGLASWASIYPLDSIKSMMQSVPDGSGPGSRSFFAWAAHIHTHHGIGQHPPIAPLLGPRTPRLTPGLTPRLGPSLVAWAAHPLAGPLAPRRLGRSPLAWVHAWNDHSSPPLPCDPCRILFAPSTKPSTQSVSPASQSLCPSG